MQALTESVRPQPNVLAIWPLNGISQREVLEHFEALPGADPAELRGLWRGQSLPTGHPLDSLLEALGWYGKAILPDGRVHPLLFRRSSGELVALDPAWMPTVIALRWPALARSSAARAVFHAASHLLRARGPSARLEVREFHGRRGAAIVYNRQHIVDHLRRLDDDRLVGIMERLGMTAPYVFLLCRETEEPTRSER